MTKAKYKSLCEQQTTEWLRASAASPTKYMSRVHVLIILIVLRERGEYHGKG